MSHDNTQPAAVTITPPANSNMAEFAISNDGKLGIGKGADRIRLEPEEVVQMMDFLNAVTYKQLAQRIAQGVQA